MMHEHWEKKKTLSTNVSNPELDLLYATGIESGAWGGKVVGAGNGGCLLFMAPIEKHPKIVSEMYRISNNMGLQGFKLIPFNFEYEGTKILYGE
jgi:D-glycero-alpha-D-manno-heptose-7-phosphate kinase